MSWRDKSDLGTQLVANVKELLRIPDEWLIDRNRGFTWWAGDYAQSIWADLGLFHNGVTIYRLHCETEMLRGHARSAECEQLISKLMSRCTLSGVPDGQGPRTSVWYISSAKNGVNGAASNAIVTSAS